LVRFSVIQSVTQNAGLFVPQGYVPQKRMCGMGEAKKAVRPAQCGAHHLTNGVCIGGLAEAAPQKSAV